MDGNAAVVRHRGQGAGSFEGAAFTDDQPCVMVWERLTREWRLVMEQCSVSDRIDLAGAACQAMGIAPDGDVRDCRQAGGAADIGGNVHGTS